MDRLILFFIFLSSSFGNNFFLYEINLNFSQYFLIFLFIYQLLKRKIFLNKFIIFILIIFSFNFFLSFLFKGVNITENLKDYSFICLTFLTVSNYILSHKDNIEMMTKPYFIYCKLLIFTILIEFIVFIFFDLKISINYFLSYGEIISNKVRFFGLSTEPGHSVVKLAPFFIFQILTIKNKLNIAFNYLIFLIMQSVMGYIFLFIALILTFFRKLFLFLLLLLVSFFIFNFIQYEYIYKIILHKIFDLFDFFGNILFYLDVSSPQIQKLDVSMRVLAYHFNIMIKVFYDGFIFGLGLNNISLYQNEIFKLTQDSASLYNISGNASMYLRIIGEIGIVGIVLLIIYLYKSIIYLMNNFNSSNYKFIVAVVLCLPILYLRNGNYLNYFLIFYLLISLYFINKVNLSNKNDK